MNVETYRPDVGKFIKYYTDQALGKQQSKKTLQIGGSSLGARRANKMYYIVSPTEQAVKQAEALLEKTPKVVKSRRPTKPKKRTVKKKKTQLG